MRTVGVMMAGLAGAIGGTVVAGVELLRRGTIEPVGLLTETGRLPRDGVFSHPSADAPLVREVLDLVPLDGLRFSGWDLKTHSLRHSVGRDRVLPVAYQEPIAPYLSSIVPRAGIVIDDTIMSVGNGGRPFRALRQAVDAMRRDIDRFRAAAAVDQVVVVSLLPTAPPAPDDPIHSDLDRFEAALDNAVHRAISPGMLYFYAACQEGCPFLNFPPNVVEVPALQHLARQCRIPFAGRDGKTGQTFIKTVLAPAFRARQLRVRGWFSTNILGNADGAALADPEACKTKLVSKTSVLEGILGYPITSEAGEPSHIVTIHYYPPRGDAKEAWDNIDLSGFLNVPMQVKVNFLCQDSLLAAPLVIDMVRLAAHAQRRGESGPLTYLSVNFKAPLPDADGRTVHDFFQQERMLARYVERCAADTLANSEPARESPGQYGARGVAAPGIGGRPAGTPLA